jgi:competence protein ComEC
MRSAVIGFALGVVFLQTMAALPAVWLLCCLLALAVLSAAATCKISYKIPYPHLKSVANLLAGALFGIAWAGLFAHYYLQHELAPEWEGRDITVIGTVDSLPAYFETGVRFTFAVEKVLDQDGESPVVPGRLALGWYQTTGQQLSAQTRAKTPIQAGARWQLTVRLKRPHGNANPNWCICAQFYYMSI